MKALRMPKRTDRGRRRHKPLRGNSLRGKTRILKLVDLLTFGNTGVDLWNGVLFIPNAIQDYWSDQKSRQAFC
jgi:hypothetical protein